MPCTLAFLHKVFLKDHQEKNIITSTTTVTTTAITREAREEAKEVQTFTEKLFARAENRRGCV